MVSVVTFDEQSLEAFDRQYERLFNEGDYEAMASVYTDDARIMPEDMEPVVGPQAIAGFWKVASERAKAINMRRTLHHGDVDHSGDLAYRRGGVTLEVPLPEGGTAMTIRIKYVTVWKRGSDGLWRVHLDISNRDAPMASGEDAYGVGLDQSDGD